MARSLIPSIVKNTGKDLATAGILFGAGILLLGYLNNHFGILNKFVSGVGKLGFATGQAVGTGIAAIPAGIGAGTVSAFIPGGNLDQAIRNALGLSKETGGQLNLPFTNIPFPGQVRTESNPPASQNPGQSTNQNAGLAKTSPTDARGATVGGLSASVLARQKALVAANPGLVTYNTVGRVTYR